MTVKQIFDLGLWDKVCEYKGWNSWCYSEGQIDSDEIVEFDSEFKKLIKELQNIYTNEFWVIRNLEGLFVYGEYDEIGEDFNQAKKFVDSDDANNFINHNTEYDNDYWNVF
jgi:hypothetical protein